MKLLLLFTLLGICLPDSTGKDKSHCKKPPVEKTSFQFMPAGIIINI